MLFLNNDDIAQVLTPADCVRVHEEGELELARGELAARPRFDTITATPAAGHFYRWGTVEAASKALQTQAIRLKSDVVYYERRNGHTVEEKYASRPGLYCGLVFLFDTSNGEPLALLQDGLLQQARVGAKNALGVKYLSRADSKTVGMLGSGGQARSHLSSFCAVRPIESCKVYSPTPAHREAYAAEMRESLGIDVVAVDSPHDAVAEADILACCTNSMEPVLFGDMVERGMHLTNVSGEWSDEVTAMVDVSARSAPSHQFQGAPIDMSQGRGGAAAVYAAANDEELRELESISGDRYGPITPGDRPASGETARQVLLADLIEGKAQGRSSDEEISASTGIGSGGTSGLSFVVVGRLVYDLARARGLGTELPTELFLQDIKD